MKKLITYFLTALFICSYGYGQVTVTESFDNTTFPPSGWANTAITGSYVWERVTSGSSPTCSPHSGAAMLRYNSYSSSSGNNAILVTPSFDMSYRSGGPATVSFWMYRDNGYNTYALEGVYVYANTSASLTGATLIDSVIRARTYYPIVAADGWYQYTYNIPASFSGSTNYLIFKAYSQYGNNMFIDDISYTTYPPAMVYSSSTTTQTNTALASWSTNQEIIGVQVVTTGGSNPLNVSSITFNTNGTTSTSDIASAKVFYTGTSNTFSTTTQFGSAVAAPNGTFTVNGSQNLVEGTNYFWLAYDVSSGAANNNLLDAQCTSITVGGTARTLTVTDPAGSRAIKAPLGGNYTVGTGGNFENLYSIFNEINQYGLRGNTTLSIISNITEPQKAQLNQWNEYTGSNFTLTIQPSGGSRTIYGNFTGGVIMLNGADRVTIDGSAGTNSQNMLTIINQSTSSGIAAVHIASLGVGLGATNNTIKYCNLKCATKTTSSSCGIIIGGTSITSSGADNDNNSILNNNIGTAYYGIYAYGTSAGTHDNLIVSGNTIGSATDAESINQYGMYLLYLNNFTIKNNTFRNIVYSSATDGIYISTGVTNGNIYGNTFRDMKSTGTYRATGIYLYSGSGSGINVFNNSFFGIIGNGTGGNSYATAGIFINGGGGYNIYYNTINLTGDRDAVGSSKPSSISAAIYIGTSVTSLDIRNNILVNTQTAATNNVKSYAIYSGSANTAFTNINYNNYYVSGSQGMLAYLSADKSTIGDWRTATNQDANSVSKSINFISNTDLHLTGASAGDAELTAPPVNNVTVDFDNETRHTQRHYIGVDEVTPTLGFTSNLTQVPNVNCIGSTVTLSITPSVSGFADGISRSGLSGFTYKWFKNGQLLTDDITSSKAFASLIQTDSAVYQARAYYGMDSIVSATSLVRVETPIAITVQPPTNMDVCIGDASLALSVASSGTVTSYQWQREDMTKPGIWTDIEGQITNSMTITLDNAEAATGNYRVLVIGPGNCGPAQVPSSITNVFVSVPLTNVIASYEFDRENVCNGDNITLTANSSGTVFGYQWQKKDGATYKNLDLAKYPTARQQTLVMNNVDPSETAIYRCIVYGSPRCNTEQVFTQDVDITIWPLFEILKHPVPQAICSGENIEMYVISAGTVHGYRWQKDGVDLDLATYPTANTAFLIVNGADYKKSGVYTCVLDAEDCQGRRDITTNPALVTIVRATEIVDVVQEQAVRIGDLAYFEVNAHVEGALGDYKPEVQWYRGTQKLNDDDRYSGTKSSILTIRDVQPSDIGEDYWVEVEGLCGTAQAKDIKLLSPGVNITSQPASAVVCEGESAVSTITAEMAGGARELRYQWMKGDVELKNDSRITGVNTASLSINNFGPADVANDYKVVITILPGNITVTSTEFELSLATKPVITTQPVNVNIENGREFSLTVAATGSDLNYQWYKNDGEVSGATSSTYTVAAASDDDEGSYRCRIWNNCAEVYSQAVTVSVNYAQMLGMPGESTKSFGLVNEPNPFNGETMIRFTLNEESEVRISLNDMLGREIAVIANGIFPAGSNSVRFVPAGSNIASGLYYYTLTTGGKHQTEQMIIVK